MKNIIKTAIGLICMSVFCISCEKMNDLHQEYLDKGEKIYVTRLDSVESFPGKNRVKLRMYVPPTRVDGIKIFWGSGFTDSLQIGMDQVEDGIVEAIISGLQEGSSFFKIMTVDKFGNYSLPMEVAGESYGDYYQAELRNNSIDSTKYENDQFSIYWQRIPLHSESMDLIYTAKSGQEVTQTVGIEKVTVLDDYKQGSGLRYRTAYRPVPECMDLFYTEFDNYTPPLE